MEDWNWQTLFYGQYRTIFNHCDIIRLKIYRIRWKTQNKGFKVIEVGTNRKPELTSYLVPFRSYCSLLFKFWTLCFEPPLGGGGVSDNVQRSSWAHWKARSGLPISVNWSFSQGVTAESLRAKQRSNIGDFAPTQSVWSEHLRNKGLPSHQNFLHG